MTRRQLKTWQWVSPLEDISEKDLSAALGKLGRFSTHPIAVAMAEALDTAQEDKDQQISNPGISIVSVMEIPHLGLMGEAKVKGKACHLAMVRMHAWKHHPHAFFEQGLQKPDDWPKDHIAILGEPTSAIFLDHQLVALAWFNEEMKPGVAALVKELKSKGRPVVLVSGDHPDRVQKFAEACGIEQAYGGLSPEEKRSHAQDLRRRYGKVLAMGDGFNDSLLLGESDFAIAVAGDAPLLAEGADILFTGTHPSQLSALLRLSHGVRRGLVGGYAVSAFYNVLAVSLAFFGWVSPLWAAILMPVSSLTLAFTAYWVIPRSNERLSLPRF